MKVQIKEFIQIKEWSVKLSAVNNSINLRKFKKIYINGLLEVLKVKLSSRREDTNVTQKKTVTCYKMLT